MNKQGLAKALRVSTNSITAWIGKGCPSSKLKDGSYQFDLPKVQAWREKTRRVRVTGDKTLADAQLRKENALAALRELELGRKRGELVEKAKVEAAAFRVGRQVRDSLLGLPDRLAGIIAAEPSQAKIHALLTRELRQCLEALTSDGRKPNP